MGVSFRLNKKKILGRTMNIDRKFFYMLGLSLFVSYSTLFAGQSSDVNTTATKPIKETIDIMNQMGEYGTLITNSLYFIVMGMLVIYLLHTLTSKFLYPHIKNRRIIKVFFGALYALILVVSVLMVLNKLGFDVRNIGKVAILSVLMAAVVIFFLLPFLPRLPFKIGHMVEINGVLGTVDSITTYHTTIRKFDGTMVFIPNALIIASKIMNYHDIPDRRIELNLAVSTESDIEEVEKLLKTIMTEDEYILNDPAPAVFVTNADIEGIKFSAYCWVKNADWLSTRGSLWTRIQKEFVGNDQISMSRPQQEIYLIDKK